MVVSAGWLPDTGRRSYNRIQRLLNRLRLNGTGESLFRPEDTRIVAPGDAQFSGTIASVFFLGDHTRLMVDCGGAQLVTVETIERREFTVGERLHLAVDQAALLSL